MNSNNKKAMGLLGIGIAIAIGTTIGVLLTPKDPEAAKEEIMAKAKEIAKKFKKTRAEIKEMVEDIFGEATEELEKIYLQIRGQIFAMSEEAKEEKKLNEEKYREIVREVIEEFSKGEKWGEKEVAKLRKNLEKAWQDME